MCGYVVKPHPICWDTQLFVDGAATELDREKRAETPSCFHAWLSFTDKMSEISKQGGQEGFTWMHCQTCLQPKPQPPGLTDSKHTVHIHPGTWTTVRTVNPLALPKRICEHVCEKAERPMAKEVNTSNKRGWK